MPLPRSPSFVSFSSSEAIKWNLAGSSLTERGTERKNRLVFYRGFCSFFLFYLCVCEALWMILWSILPFRCIDSEVKFTVGFYVCVVILGEFGETCAGGYETVFQIWK